MGAGRRILFTLPVVTTVVLPAVFGGAPDQFAFDQSTVPHGIDVGWASATYVEGCDYRFCATWWGVAVDLAFVLLPTVALALLVQSRRERPARWPARPGSQAVAIAVSLSSSCR